MLHINRFFFSRTWNSRSRYNFLSFSIGKFQSELSIVHLKNVDQFVSLRCVTLCNTRWCAMVHFVGTTAITGERIYVRVWPLSLASFLLTRRKHYALDARRRILHPSRCRVLPCPWQRSAGAPFNSTSGFV